MIKKLRVFMRTNPFARRTVYPVAWYFMNKVLHWRSRLLQTYGIDILLKVQEAARWEGIQCSPYFGTLLGLVRDGKLIKHDTDMDFVISPESNNVNGFYNHLKSVGFVPERVILLNNKMLEFTMCYRALNVDFFLVGESAAKDMNIFVFNDRGEVRLHKYPKIPGMEEMIVANGTIVMVPKNATDHLENEYGNWRVPNRKWDARRGPSFRGILDGGRCEFQCIMESETIDRCFRSNIIERIEGVQFEKILCA